MPQEPQEPRDPVPDESLGSSGGAPSAAAPDVPTRSPYPIEHLSWAPLIGAALVIVVVLAVVAAAWLV